MVGRGRRREVGRDEVRLVEAAGGSARQRMRRMCEGSRKAGDGRSFDGVLEGVLCAFSSELALERGEAVLQVALPRADRVG